MSVFSRAFPIFSCSSHFSDAHIQHEYRSEKGNNLSVRQYLLNILHHMPLCDHLRYAQGGSYVFHNGPGDY